MTQTDRLIAHLTQGRTITPLEAWLELGIYRLSGRIYDAKRMGLRITKQMISVKNRFGEAAQVAEYKLEEEQLCLNV